MITLVHLGLLGLSLSGFFALALASERQGVHLLGREPEPHERHLARAVGWLLLAVALGWSLEALHTGIGMAMWFGWLSVAGVALVFAFPKWPWQPPVRDKPARPSKESALPPQPAARWRRRAAATLLVVTGAVFATALAKVEPQLLARQDAVRGQVGPWSFTLAEAHREAPELMAMDVPFKEFRIRFCDSCDLQIRQITLKVNQPRSERATGMAFFGQRWERKVEIPLPSTTNADSELWLTVTGKDGSVHQTMVKLAQVSPSTLAWFNEQRKNDAQP